MRLLSLKVDSHSPNGWSSPLLEFGQRTTLLFAKNGSGKTPIIQSITAGIGFPLSFRDDIFEKCDSITLTTDVNGKSLIFCRKLDTNNTNFKASINFEGDVSEFYNEADFSKKLFEYLDLNPPRLITSAGAPVLPYISSVLPIFYINQSDGYVSAYKSPSSFIKDQYVEMIRFIFGLNPKNSFDRKKELIEKRLELQALTKKIASAREILNNQSQGLDISLKNKLLLEQRKVELIQEIDSLRNSFNATSHAFSTLTDHIKRNEQLINSTQAELSELVNRINGIKSIRSEIEAEIKTLSLNEAAKQIFTSFHEVCANPNCGLFLGSAESYGKSLLYLHDQIKDLNRNSELAEARISLLNTQIEELKTETQSLNKQLNQEGSNESDNLIIAVQSLTKQLINTQFELSKIKALRKEDYKISTFEEKRELTQERINSLSKPNSREPSFNKLILSLKDLIPKWMDILETKNVNQNITIDSNLKIKFGTESLELFSGSTQIRLILAIRTALFEAYISDPSRPFRFLILDTPKQQELQTEDLATYLSKLEELCLNNNAQLIISSTEYDHPTEELDERWLPKYQHKNALMYLGQDNDFLCDQKQ